MRKINEIFHSIQGEGCRAGVPSVFIRFSGCNMSCDFCDTRHQEGRWMNDDEIIAAIKRQPTAQIILTGGEPSLFIDSQFIIKLKQETGLSVAIETNGTNILPEEIDWVTVSPKDCDGAGRPRKDLNALIKAKRADELKVVDVGQDLSPYFQLECVAPETVMLLQPCYVDDPVEREKNTRRTIGRVLEDPRWRLSLQTHRLINIK